MAIIQVGDTFYTTTYHADAGMANHNITEKEIAEVILEGDFDYTESGNEIYIKRIDKRKIAVVVAEATEKIVTVYQIED